MFNCNDFPEDWTVKTYGYDAVDLPVALRIKYIGSQEEAHVSIANTTGDMRFEQGATTAAAAVTTGTNPGTAGVIDISDLTYMHELINKINVEGGGDWEAWPVDLLPDEAVEISAGNAMFKTNLTDRDCTGENGFAVVVDTSLKTAEDFCVGVTFNGPKSQIHNHDANVLHRIHQIRANVTYGGASDGIYVYACNDRDNTKEEIDHLALTSATATNFPASGDIDGVLYQKQGRRLVFKALDASGAITPVSLYVLASSKVVGPSINKSQLMGNY